jgi:hypothetical protein
MKSNNNKNPSFIDVASMPDSDEKWKLAEKLGFKSIKPRGAAVADAKNWNMKLPEEKSRVKYIKGDPDSKGKSELEIEKEILFWLRSQKIEHFQTKVKGEIQSIGNGKAILKRATNPGFPDIVAIRKGQFVGIEVKRPGGSQSVDQQSMEKRINAAGGVYVIVTSVTELITKLLASQMPDYYF